MVLFARSFSQGLRVVIPLAITVFVVYGLGTLLESMLGRWLKLMLPDNLAWVSWRGAGVVLSLLTIFFLGLLFYFPFVRIGFAWLEKGFERIPVIRTIYGSSRDLVQYFVEAGGGRAQRRFSKVVLVRIGGNMFKLLGLITQEDSAQLPKGLNQKDGVLVFLPMSYQLGGYTVLVPRDCVEPVDLSVEEALRFAMTAGVSRNGYDSPEAHLKRAAPCG